MGLISSLAEKIEKRSWGVDDDRWYISAGNIRPSATGVEVNETTALAYSAVYACVRVIAETIASLPLFLYRRTKDGKEKANSNPLFAIMHDRPNPEITAMLYRETCMMHLLLSGNSYSQIIWDGAGRVKELWPITPYRVTPKRDQSGKVIYIVRGMTGDIVIQNEDMLHVAGLGFNGLVGMSPLEHAKESIGLGLATQEYGSRFFQNNARPSGILEHPGKLSAEAGTRLRDSWESVHKGLSNAHRVAILEEGLKFHELSISQEAAQYLQTRRFQLEEICRIYRVPPHLIGAVEKAFTNIEQQSIEFVMYCVRPWCIRLEQTYSKTLLTSLNQGSLFFEHSVDGLQRGDIATRYNAYSVARQQGWLNVNEIRALENMNPIDNGDIYLQPLNMVEAGQQQSINPNVIKNPGDIKKNVVEKKTSFSSSQIEYRSLDEPEEDVKKSMQKAFQKVVAKEVIEIREAAKKMLSARSRVQFNQFLESFYEDHKSWVKTKLEPLINEHADAFYRAASDIIGADFTITHEIEKFAAEYLETLAYRYCHKGQAELKSLMESINPSDVAKAIDDRCSEWLKKKAGKNAESESVRLQNAVARETWKAHGVQKIKWKTRGSLVCPFCNRMNGKTVGIRDNFLNANDVIYSHPEHTVTDTSDPNYGKGFHALKVYSAKKHPPIHKGCKCTISPA